MRQDQDKLSIGMHKENSFSLVLFNSIINRLREEVNNTLIKSVDDKK